MVKCLDHNRAEIKCDSATNGSTASFECANYYEPAERTALKRFCWEGVWNLQPPQCVPGQPIVVIFNINYYNCNANGCSNASDSDHIKDQHDHHNSNSSSDAINYNEKRIIYPDEFEAMMQVDIR